MIRLATGDMSAVLAGRVALRAHQYAHQGLDGPRRPDHQGEGHVRAARAGRRGRASAIRSLPRVRLAVTREGEQDAMTLQAECATPSAASSDAVAETLQAVTKLKGAVKLVAPGTLPNDGKVIADERPVG